MEKKRACLDLSRTKNHQSSVGTRDGTCLSTEMSQTLVHTVWGTNNNDPKNTSNNNHNQISSGIFHWKQVIEDDALVHFSPELPLGPDSLSQFFMKHFRVSIQTKLKLFAYIHLELLPNCTGLCYCTEFYTPTSTSTGTKVPTLVSGTHLCMLRSSIDKLWVLTRRSIKCISTDR